MPGHRARSFHPRWFTIAGPLALMLALVPVGVVHARDCPADAEQRDACGGGANTDVGSAPPPSLPRVRLGNPISLVTGTKTQQETDFELDDAPLGFRRLYSSANADTDIGLGQGWRHSYAVALYATDDGGRQIVESGGRRVPFEPTADDPARFVPALASDGRLIDTGEGHEWHLPDGRTLSFRGRWLVRVNWPGHRFLDLRYSSRGLVAIADETGRTLRLEYAPGKAGLTWWNGGDEQVLPGHLSALVLPDGERIAYAYDGRRNLTRAVFPDGTARRYHYEDETWPNHLTGLTERTGTRFATWAYDAAGRAVLSEHADGVERVTLAIDAPATIGDEGTTLVTDSAGAVSTYTWRRHVPSGTSLLLTARGPGCVTCPPTNRRYLYDEDGRLVATTRLDDDGAVLAVRRRERDTHGRVLRIVETLSAADGTPTEQLVERREYAAAGDVRPRRISRPSVDPDAERSAEIVRGANGLVVAVLERGRTPTFDPSGTPTGFAPIERAVRIEHDTAGRPVAIDGPRDDVDDRTRLEWDGTNRLVGVLPPGRPALRVTRFDAAGRPAELRVGTRTPVRLERDAQGNVAAVRRGETVVRYEHDAEGRLTAIVDPDGRTVRIAHDAAGRIGSVTDDLGRVDALVRDDESRVVGRSVLGIDGATVRDFEYLFDADGRLTRSIERRARADGSTVATSTLGHEVDASGLSRRLTNPGSGASASSELDLIARLATFVGPDGATTTIGYDVAGRDAVSTDARGNVTRYPKDDFGRVVLHASPDTGAVRYTVDPAGNRVRATRAGGTEVRTAFDAANRPVERVDANGTTQWRYGVESDGGAHGRLVEAANPTTTERFTYDAEGRLASHVREIDGHAFETRYAYDARDRLTTKHLPDGQRLAYHYHESGPDRGALRAITRGRWWGLAAETVVGEIDLDARDGRAGWTSGTGVRTEQRFAPNGELVELGIGRTLQLRYTFDGAGRIVGIDENGTTRRYGYDAGRLASASSPDAELRYAYDALGNRTSRVERTADGTTTATAYAYPTEGAGNRLLGTIDAASGLVATYRYDGAGSPLTTGVLHWRYDANGRPIEAYRDGSLVASYAYNAFGERVRKVVHTGPGAQPTVTYFLYDGSTLTAEADGTGRIASQYVHLDGHRPVAKLEGDALFGIHGDHLGTPRVMTNASGEVVWKADYTPFGEATVSRSNATLNLRLPGQYADVETGTHYNYLRDYDPGTGRYLTSDPIGLAGGPNLYAYVDADPLLASDPLGLFRAYQDAAESDALIARLATMSVAEIETFVATELSSFADRRDFYTWAHLQFVRKPEATQTNWFLAASQVNGMNALGGIDLPLSWVIYDDETKRYLRDAGEQLAVHNIQTFVTMIQGGFVYDACVVGETEAERTHNRDMMLVGYEQHRLEQITRDYFDARPEGEADAVFADINAFFNGESVVDEFGGAFASDTIDEIIRQEFTDQGIAFDISNVSHRITLGQRMVEKNRREREGR